MWVVDCIRWSASWDFKPVLIEAETKKDAIKAFLELSEQNDVVALRIAKGRKDLTRRTQRFLRG